jgi:DNA-binding NtrC family response regulator
MVTRLELPPLRDRRSDIPLLVSYLVEQKRNRLNRPGVCRVSHAAMDMLVLYDWPGNVRQLENVIEAAILQCAGDTIEVPNLVFASAGPEEPTAADADTPFRAARLRAISMFERRYLLTLLRRHAGNITETARHAGITSKHVRVLLRRHGIDRRDFRSPVRLRALSRSDDDDGTAEVRFGDVMKS